MLIAGTLTCLALNVYFESRGESLAGQYGVALVTLNRAEQTSRNVCDVVMAPKQFSWTDRVQRRHRRWVLPKDMAPVETDAWKKAVWVATVTMTGVVADITRGATYYDRKDVHPAWEKKMRVVAKIGRHRFMVPIKSSVT